MHEADHVVVAVGEHRQPGMRHAGRDRGGRGHRRLRVQEDHLGARHQHLADLPFPGVEHLAHDVPLVRAERLRAGHQVAQLLLGHGLAADAGVAAEDGDHQVGRHGQQPDDRPGQRRDPVQQRRGEQGQPRRPLQRDPLGRELAEHQADERDAHGHHDERQRRRPARRHVLADQPRLEEPGQGRGAVGAGDQGGQGHADLHGGEEPGRVAGQPRGPLAAPAPLGQRPDLAFAQRDESHLRGREESPDADDDQDDDDVQDDLAHDLPAARLRGAFGWLAAGPHRRPRTVPSRYCVWPV